MIRLFVTDPLAVQQSITLSKEQSHYVMHVMRRKVGDVVALFNGKDGEWQAEITFCSKKSVDMLITQPSKPQAAEPNITLCFAPVKNAPQHFLVQKATELGVSALQPVITAHTIVTRVNTEKLAANVMEAAEQCGRLTVPEVLPAVTLDQWLKNRDTSNPLFFCDETGGGKSALDVLSSLPINGFPSILIGPEGGFSKEELAMVRAQPDAYAMGLGPRILRADTAALAALTLVQAVTGDWNIPPRFEAEQKEKAVE